MLSPHPSSIGDFQVVDVAASVPIQPPGVRATTSAEPRNSGTGARPLAHRIGLLLSRAYHVWSEGQLDGGHLAADGSGPAGHGETSHGRGVKNHQEAANFIWSVADEVLRGTYTENDYGKIILPFVLIRR